MRGFVAAALCGILLIGSVGISAARDISRIRADQSNCADILDRIAHEGAVLLRYPSKRVANYILYDRYVAGDRFCDWPDEEARLDPVATRDARSCPVRTCQRKIEIFPVFPD